MHFFSVAKDLIKYIIVECLDDRSQLKARRICKRLRDLMDTEGLSVSRFNLIGCPFGENVRVKNLTVSFDNLKSIVDFCNKYKTETIRFLHAYVLQAPGMINSPDHREFMSTTIKSITFETNGEWSDGMRYLAWAPFMEYLAINSRFRLTDKDMAELCKENSKLKELHIKTSNTGISEPLKRLQEFKELTTLAISVDRRYLAQKVIDVCQGTSVRTLELTVIIHSDESCIEPIKIEINESCKLENIILRRVLVTLPYNNFIFDVKIGKQLKKLEVHGGFIIRSSSNQKLISAYPAYNGPITIFCKEIEKIYVAEISDHFDIQGVEKVQEMTATTSLRESIGLGNGSFRDLPKRVRNMTLIIDNGFSFETMGHILTHGLNVGLCQFSHFNYSIYREDGSFVYNSKSKTEPQKKQKIHQ